MHSSIFFFGFSFLSFFCAYTLLYELKQK